MTPILLGLHWRRGLMRKVTVAALIILTSMFVAPSAHADLVPDATFSGDGVAYLDPDGNNWFEDVVGVDGGYLVAGVRQQSSIQVVKYADDGSRVRSFGHAGVVTVDVGTRYPYGPRLAVLSDGRIIVALGRGQRGFALFALRPDGQLAKRFGEGGVVKRAFEPGI